MNWRSQPQVEVMKMPAARVALAVPHEAHSNRVDEAPGSLTQGYIVCAHFVCGSGARDISSRTRVASHTHITHSS